MNLLIVVFVVACAIVQLPFTEALSPLSSLSYDFDDTFDCFNTTAVVYLESHRRYQLQCTDVTVNRSSIMSSTSIDVRGSASNSTFLSHVHLVVVGNTAPSLSFQNVYYMWNVTVTYLGVDNSQYPLLSSAPNNSSSSSAEPPPWSQGNDYQPLKAPLLAFSMFNGNHGTHVTVEFVNTTLWCLFQMIRDDVSQNSGTSGGGILTGEFSSWKFVSFYVWNSTMIISIPPTIVTLTSLFYFGHQPPPLLPLTSLHVAISCSDLRMTAALRREDTDVTIIAIAGTSKLFDSVLRDVMIVVLDSNLVVKLFSTTCVQAASDAGIIMLNLQQEANISVFIARSSVAVVTNYSYSSIVSSCQLFAHSASLVFSGSGPKGNHSTVCIVNMTSVDLAAAGYVTVVQYRTSDPITGFTVVVEGEHSSLGERASPHVPSRCPMKEEVLLHCPPSLLSESSSLCEHSNNNQLLSRSTAGGVNVPIYDSAAAAAIYRVVAFHFVFLVASRLAALVMIASDAYTSNTTVLVSGVTMWASCLSGNGSALIGSASALVQLGAPTEAPAVIIEVYDSLLIVMLVDGVAPILMSIPFLPNPMVIAFQVAASLVQLAPASSTNKVMWNAAVTVQRCSVSASVGYDVPPDQKITGVLASSVSVLVVSTAVKSSTFVLFENTVNGTDNFASFSQHMSTTSSAPTAAAFLRTVSVLAVCDTSTFAPVVALAKVNSAYVDFLRTISIDHVVVVIQDTLVTYSGSVVVSESTTATAPSSSSSSGSGFIIVPTDVSSIVMMPSVVTHSTITVVNTTAASSSTTTSDTRSNGVSALTALWTASVSQGSSFRFVDCKGLRRLVTVLDGTLKVDLPPPTPAASPPPTQEEMIDQDNLSVFLFHDVETTFLNLSRFDASSSSSSSSSVVLAPLSVISPLQGLQVPVGVYVVGRSGVSALRSDLSGLSAISTGIVVRLNQTYGSCVASSAFSIRGGSFRGSFDGVVAAVPGVTFQYANGTDVGAGWSSDIGTSPSLAFCRERFLDLTGCTQWQGLPIAKNVVAVGTNRVSLMSHVYVNERCQSSATLSGSLQHIPIQQLALPVAMVSATTPTASLFVASLIIQQLSPVQSANAGGARSLQGTLMIRRLRALCRISNSAVKGSGSSTTDDSSDSESNTNTVNSLCCDLSTSPMQLKFVIGSRHAPSDHTTDISSFVGGVVGNTVLVVGVAVLKMLFARLLRAWNTTKGPSVASVLQQQTSLPLSKSQELALSKANTRSEVNAFLSHAAEVLGEDAPVSAMWPTYTALLTPTISITIGCVVVLALDSTNDVSAEMTTNAVVVCLLGVLWLVVWVGAMIAVVGWRSDASCCNDCTFTRTRSFPLQPAPLRRRSNLGTSSESLCLNVLFEPTEGVAIRRRPFEAVRSDRIRRQHAKSLLAHYGAVFGAYRVSLFWYFNVELLFSFVNGVVGGYAFAEAAIDPCNAIVPWLLVGLGVLEVAVVVVLRPYMVRVDMIALVSVTCISVATGICAVVADDDDELGNILGSLGSAVQLLFLAASVLWAAVQHRCAPRLGASTVLQTLPSNDDDNNHDRRSRADDPRSSLRRTAQLGRNYDHLAKKTQNQDALPQKRLEQLVWIICNDRGR